MEGWARRDFSAKGEGLPESCHANRGRARGRAIQSVRSFRRLPFGPLAKAAAMELARSGP